MAEDKIVEATDKSKKSDNEVVSAKSSNQEQRYHKPLAFTALLVLFLLLLGGAFAVGHHAWRTNGYLEAPRLSGYSQMEPRSGGLHGGMFWSSEDTSTSNTRVSGVVTSVNGDTITVAGNGTTTKVTVSDNTTYTGSSEPAKINDTIIAIGAKNSEDTLIASSVYLTRQ